jgi:putative membrane protein
MRINNIEFQRHAILQKNKLKNRHMKLLIFEFALNWGWVLGLIIIFATLWLVVKVLSKKSPPNKKSLDILKERYAKGLITRSEFEEKRGVIL